MDMSYKVSARRSLQYVSVVEQDTHLFNTTIRENLMLARADATEEEMIQAANRHNCMTLYKRYPMDMILGRRTRAAPERR